MDEKVEAVREMKFPRNLRELETGLGFFGYYRKFIEHCAAIARPLVQLKTEGFRGGLGDVSGSRLTSPAADSVKPLTLPAKRALPELWTSGKPFSAQYCYDEPLNAADNLDLSDARVVQVVKANFRVEDREKKWPAVFSSKL